MRASINVTTHSSWRSGLWPHQVVSSYHRLTSLMTIASHANAPASPGPNNRFLFLFIFCENVMQLRWNYAALFGHSEQCFLLLTKKQTLDSSGSPEANLAAMKDDSRSLSVLAMKWWISKDQKKRQTHVDVCHKSWAQGWELSFSILSCKPLCLVLKVISCLPCPVCVLPGPPSHIPWPWPLLHTAAQFNLPNAVMGQANQPPEGETLGPS